MAGRKITIALGLMSFEAKMDGAVDKPASASSLCIGQPGKPAHEAKPVQAPKVCGACGTITDYDSLLKGVKTSTGSFTLVDQDAANEARAEYTAEYLDKINLVPHPSGDVLGRTAPGDGTYYITPADAGGADRYQLLVKLIEAHPEVTFAGLHTIKSANRRTHLWAMQVREGVLVMQKRVREGDMKPVPSVGGTINEKFYDLLDGTLEALIEPYSPEAYEDRYALAIAAMLEAGEEITVEETETAAKPTKKMTDDDIMAQLLKLQKAA